MKLHPLCSTKMAVPVGLSLVSVGILLLTVSIAGNKLFPSAAHFGQGKVDFVRGFLVGFGIVMEVMGLATMIPAVVGAKAQRAGDSSAQTP